MTTPISTRSGSGGQTENGRRPLAAARPETQTEGALSVSSSSLKAGQAIPAKYSEYAEGISPPLDWSPIDDAACYALILEDPDAKTVKPFTHWLAWNIPAATTELPEGLRNPPRLTEGANDRGSAGYFGPRPPEGDPPHHYHFQVFALDRQLDLPSGADRDQLLSAMQGHVLAKGELVGTYQQSGPAK